METLKMNVYGKEQEIILPVKKMVGTVFYGSDRYVVVCTNVYSNKKCSIVILYRIEENNYKEYVKTDKDGIEYLKDEFYDKFMNEYEIEKINYSLRKNGVWYPIGNPIQSGCGGIRFGYAMPYQDPSF